ncbi:TonB-dependent receptor [Chitinophagaceae bacterium LB-8]|uniref:TonB-dependent receptor n=1 Tax=Paraflavisolibacter caeni TaxID=2982496 RepID=A0A9X3B9L8_9BACT|nr:TonB-dependent receptor [Paraflavisolibacter caeni]MCU7552230.1 TonB-dependent receptor [Paraflavisolibacter caeni]
MRIGLLPVLMIMCLAGISYAEPANGQEILKKKISISADQEVMKNILRQIGKKAEVKFVYISSNIPDRNKTTIVANNEELGSVLYKLLNPFNVQYEVNGDQIVLKPVALSAFITEPETGSSPVVTTTSTPIKGVVKDSDGKPLAGASVVVKGSSSGTVTNEKGEFVINVPENVSTLIVSYIGMENAEVSIKGKSSLNITMLISAAQQQDIVVVGYGKQSKQKVTSAVTTLKTDNFKDAPYTDIQSAIAGRVAGVVVNFSGGAPGSVPSLTIRGGEPLIGQNTPLYVIDGIIRDGAAFVALNVNDIENISFLKDASATAVYGAKASAGIVLVTTKSGVAGKSVINYSNNIAWNTPNLFPKLINSYDKALVANAIGAEMGFGPYSSYRQGQLDSIKSGISPDIYPNTDWYGLAFRKYASQQSHNLSLSGGNKQTKYYVGLGYFNQGSNYVNNAYKVQRFSYNTKVSSDFESIGLNVALGLSGYYSSSTQPPAGTASIFSHIVAKSPLDQAFNKDGSLAPLVDHPLAEIYSPGYSRSEAFFNDGNLTFTWNVPMVKGLSFKALGDYAFTMNPSKTFNVLATQYKTDGTIYPTPNASLSQSSNSTKAYNAEFQADYSRSFDRHSVGATFVSIVRGGSNNGFSASRNNFPSTAIDQLFAGDASSQLNNGSASEWGEVGYVGRVKYDYAAKYLLEMSGRYDGSDYFPPSKRFGFFPAVSAGWVLSSEGFYKQLNLDKVFSYLKFKGSYGETGSIGGKYAYLPTYSVNSQVYVANGNLQNGYSEGGLTVADQNITWFDTRARDFGFEFEVLNKKLSGGVDYFYTRTKNILGSPAFRYTDPLGTSLPQVLTDAATRKEGLDFSLNYNFKIKNDLKGYIGFNATYFNYLWENTNEDSVALMNPFTRSQGFDQNYYGAMLLSNGLYQDYHDILNNPVRITSTALGLGDVWLADTNGDGKIDSQDNRRLGKSQSPRFTFGVPVGLQYKGLRLDALVQGTGTRNVYLGGLIQAGEGFNRINFDFQKDYWLSSNTDASYPRAGNNTMNSGNNYTTSTFWLKNARFVRLKSVTLSYDFKRIMKKSSFFNELSAHVSGTNLWTSSPVNKYFDPELADNNNFFYPVNKTYSMGVRFGF